MDEVVVYFILGTAAVLGFFVLSYLLSNGKLKPPFLKPAKVVVYSVNSAIALAFVIAIGVALYDAADKDGWIPHTRTLSVWMQHDWLVGEFKTCSLEGTAKVPVLSCEANNGAYHDMSVEFHGSLEPLEAGKESRWNCQRKSESVSCKGQ